MSLSQIVNEWIALRPSLPPRERAEGDRLVLGRGAEWPLILLRDDGHLYDPGTGQRAFHESLARFRALVGGRGSGKTAAGAQEALKRIRDGRDGLVLSPSIPHFNTSTREEFWKWIPWQHVDQHHQTEKWIRFDTGATVYYGGIEDEDRWRGPNVNWLWFDESARKRTEQAWIVAMAGVRIGPDPAAWTTTTPRGKRHWLYRMFVAQETPPEVEKLLEELGHTGPLYEYFHASIHDNRHNLDPLFYASMLTAYTGRFREQELDGLFVETAEGMVYEEFGTDNITVDADYDPDRGPVELACDDGFAASPRVFLFIQRGDNGEVFVFDELYHTRHLAATCIGEAKDMLSSYDPEARFDIAACDPSAVEMIASFRLADIPARAGPNPVIEGIKRVRSLVRDGQGVCRLKVHPRCRNFISEMSEGYRYPEGSEGRSDVKPVKADDHGCDAARYWAMLRTRPLA